MKNKLKSYEILEKAYDVCDNLRKMALIVSKHPPVPGQKHILLPTMSTFKMLDEL